MAETSTMRSSNPLKAKLARYFRAHGQFCARHPWEVIVTVVTLTVCMLSIGVLRGGKVGTFCGLNKQCEEEEEEETSDVVLLAMINSLAVIYVYNQFSSLRKAGSKYLLSIAGLFTIFASFVFGSGVVNLIVDKRASGISEALPFFLLLIDLSKARALASFAFRSRNKDEVLKNIGRGLSVLGPNMTLDTLVEGLLIGIGTISGSQRLEIVCWFGAMSIIANFVVFMTFFPASLSLVMEVSPCDPNSTTWQLDELARDMQEEEAQKKPNPVVQRVKIIMALGLTFVHLHGWFLSGITGLSFGLAPQTTGDELSRDAAAPSDEMVKVPLQEYLLWKAFNLSGDQIVTLALSVVLFVKYIFLDKSTTFAMSVPPTPSSSAPPIDSAPVSACPIKMSDGPSIAVRQRHTTNSGASSTTYSEECPHLTEPLNQTSISSSTASNGVLPTLQSPLTLQNVSPGISSCGVNVPVSSERECLPALGAGPDGKQDIMFSSVAVQTVSEEGGVFVALRQDSLSGSDTSGVGASGDEVTTGEEEEEEDGGKRGEERPPRPVAECLSIFQSDAGPVSLSDVEILQLVEGKHIPAYKLESALGDPERGVAIRRKFITRQLAPDSASCLSDLPYLHYDFSKVMGACCENVVGYMPVPVGVAGPLLLNGEYFHVPMATTEGALVASTNRGCRALAPGGGVKSHLLGDGMTRGPVVRFPSAAEASQVKLWLDERANFSTVAEAFNGTSGFARLVGVQAAVAGRLLFIRFKATTGDAMGMNMLSKGTEKSLGVISRLFPTMEVISLSGNYCMDKKPSAINWIEGRGKSVVCEATVSAATVRQVLKTTVEALVDLNVCKNLVGSAMAGSVGGFNTHAANVVCAIFIATGQDPAQTVGSSNCITLTEKGGPSGEDLHISVTMPSLELGTVGGGTVLPAQAACLKMLGVQGPNKEAPGENAAQLARVVCGAVLAGELSLMSALAAGHLVKSHLTHNRSKLNLLSSIPETQSLPPEAAPAAEK